MVDDPQLLERMRQGDPDALRAVYDRYKDDLLTVAACISADAAAAEDVLHDVFVTFASGAAGLRVNGSLKGYLVTCVANRARDHLRRLVRRGERSGPDVAGASAADVAADGSADPTTRLIHVEEVGRLYEALATLPPEQRAVITLRLHADMTFDEIARHEGAPGNTIRSRYRYGLDKLRALLGAGVMR